MAKLEADTDLSQGGQVFNYEPPINDISVDPFAVVVASGNESEFETTSENKRTYGFTIRIFVERKQRGESGAESVLTGIVDRLVAQELVRRSESPDDRRIVLLELTDKGRETITQIHETMRGHLNTVVQRMDTEDIAALIRGMSAFIAAVDLDQKEKSVAV